MEIPEKHSKNVEKFKADMTLKQKEMWMWNMRAKMQTCQPLHSRSTMCIHLHVCNLVVCVYVIWQAVVWMCDAETITWKACAAMHVMQLRQTDKTVKQCLQTGRPEQSCVCLHVWIQYLQYSEVYEMIFFYLFAFVKEVWEIETDRDSCELSWAHVDEPECERCSIVFLQIYLMWLTSIKPGTFRATH